MRCGSLDVPVDGVQLHRNPAKVMMNDEPLDKTLPKKLEAYEQYIVQFADGPGFPDQGRTRIGEAE